MRLKQEPTGHVGYQDPKPGKIDGATRDFLVGASLRDEWDQFVQELPDSTFMHLYGWRSVIERVYGHRGYLLLSKRGTIQVAAAMVFHVRSRVLGDSLVTPPGGIIARTSADVQHMAARICRLADDLGVTFAAIRRQEAPPESCRLVRVSHYTRESRSIPIDHRSLWASIGSKRRNKVRQARTHGMVVSSDTDNLRAFYDVLARNYTRLGTPVFSFSLLAEVLREFPEAAKFVFLKKDGKVLGGNILFQFRENLSLLWSAALPSSLSMRPNDLLYWTALDLARTTGCNEIDFGTSIDLSGQQSFKRSWGCSSRPLHDIYYLRRRESVPDLRLMLNDSQWFRRAHMLWPKLPIGVAKAFGPYLSSFYPVPC